MTVTMPTAPSTSPKDPGFGLRDVIATIPRECFKKDAKKAWASVVLSIVASIVGYVAIAYSPWFLLPFAWFFTGTALTGFFVIGHDCGHGSFFKGRKLNNIVGHISFLPLMYPYHAWRVLHDTHHINTNRMDLDNAWKPFTAEEMEDAGSLRAGGYKAIRGWFWWVGSVAHWLLMHFDWTKFKGKTRQQIKFSSLLVIGAATLFFPTLIATTGVWGLIKFWVMPWLGYHFWMSTFTIVHHTAEHIPFRQPEDWNAVLAQLSGSVHCDYPKWVEVLCHDINVHVPHHVCVSIPSYNLRKAHDSLRKNWGEYLCERTFNLELMREIADNCHVYNPANDLYLSFDQCEKNKI